MGTTGRSTSEVLEREVVRAGICTGCGACAAVGGATVRMQRTPAGPLPSFDHRRELASLALTACPGRGIHYPDLYRSHYGSTPESWLLGTQCGVRVGHAADEDVRRRGASGGVTTAVLLHLLETGRIDAALVVRQGVPTPAEAGVVIARTPGEIRAAAQSVYIPVSVLDVLRDLVPGERYAMTCLPEQSAALRVLQGAGHEAARQVHYVLGPYTGTALDPAAIRSLLRSHGVADDDAITSLEWRAGEWPGHLEVHLASGAVVRSKKVYYNFLIPFFVTQTSLQSMDFANEFADLAVGDAWSPAFESAGGGHSVFVTRSPAMEEVIAEMCRGGRLVAEDHDPLVATEMHGHMLDFKKRGGYLRNRFRVITGRKAPDYGFVPSPIGAGRVATEVVISGLFLVCRTRFARWAVQRVPERIIGPLFDRLRLAWKAASKPTKRKGLRSLTMVPR